MSRKLTKHPSEKEVEKWDFTKYRLVMSKAIRLKCLDCCAYQDKEVRLCVCKNCPLYPYRFGHKAKVPVVTRSQLIGKRNKMQSKKGISSK